MLSWGGGRFIRICKHSTFSNTSTYFLVRSLKNSNKIKYYFFRKDSISDTTEFTHINFAILKEIGSSLLKSFDVGFLTVWNNIRIFVNWALVTIKFVSSGNGILLTVFFAYKLIYWIHPSYWTLFNGSNDISQQKSQKSAFSHFSFNYSSSAKFEQ